VEEVRVFRFSGSFSWANLKRSSRGQYGRYEIEYLGVWDAETKQPLRYSQTSEGEYAVLRWEYQARDTTKRFLLRYRIRHAVQRYSDVAQFYWKAIEDEHAPLDEVRVAIVPPAPSPKLFKVFVHSRAAPGRLHIHPDFTRAEIQQANIPTDSFVEVRVMLDPAIFAGAPLQAGNRYGAFLEEERRFAERELREAKRRERIARIVEALVTAEIPVVILLGFGLIGYLLVTYNRYGREPELPEIEYVREPPRDLPPAVVPAILTQNKAEPSEVIKGFSATVLEAARLGYLRIEEFENKKLLGLVRNIQRRYVLTPEGNALLTEGKVEPQGRKGRVLEPLEQEVLRVLFLRAGDGETVTESELRRWAEKTSGGKTQMYRFVARWGKALRRSFEKQYFRLDDPTSEKAKRRFWRNLLIIGGIGTVVTLPVSLFTLLPLAVVLSMIAGVSLSRRSPEAAREYQRWDAFRRFMTDFSAMRDAGADLLPLWERYLVYAVSLGCRGQADPPSRAGCAGTRLHADQPHLVPDRVLGEVFCRLRGKHDELRAEPAEPDQCALFQHQQWWRLQRRRRWWRWWRKQQCRMRERAMWTIVIALIVAIWAIATYNRLLVYRHRVENARAQVDVQLKRRYDLIPRLVETVRGYAQHEERIFERIAELRTQALQSPTPQQQDALEEQVRHGISKLIALAESYPELKANQNFLSLQEELSDTEDKIRYARQFYNDTVMRYNLSIQRFPTLLIAPLMGFREQPLFTLDHAVQEREVPS
jgi:LemA protein